MRGRESLKTYEAIFIFSNSIKEDALQKIIEQIKGEITKLKGVIKESKILGRRQFARMMKKEDSGQYARVDFDLDPSSVAPLLARFKLNESIFRLQLVAADEVERNFSRRAPLEEGIDGIA